MKARFTTMAGAILALAALAPRANAAVVFSEATLEQHQEWVAWWNEQGFLDGMTEWAEKISTFMCGSAEPARQMDFYITLEKDGLAGTGDNRITIGNDWAVGRVAANDARDVRGCIAHELTHAVQYAVGQYLGKTVNLENIIVVYGTDGTTSTNHLTEGIADWIRWYNYEPDHYRDDRRYEHFYCKGRTLTEYGDGCEFIDYLATTYGTGIVSNMCLWCATNTVSSSQKINKIWPALVGRTYDELLDDWAAKPTFADPLFQWTWDGTTEGIRREWPKDETVTWLGLEHASFKPGSDELELPSSSWYGGELQDDFESDDWTIALRGRFLASGDTTNVVFSIGSSYYSQVFALAVSKNEICAALTSGKQSSLSLASANRVSAAPSQYHSIVAVRSGDVVSVYVDGGMSPACEIDVQGVSFSGAFAIGDIADGINISSPLYKTSNWRAVQPADGFRYQDVRLFHRALSAEEISLYAAAFSSAYDEHFGWVNEKSDTTELTGKWSDGIDYEVDGRALLLGENTFTPYATSTGNVVAVDVKATLFESDGEDPVDAGTQAAIRLGANGCFQVWARRECKVESAECKVVDGELSWISVSNPNVTPVDGGEWTFRFTFDYGVNRFSVAVIADGGRYALKTADGARTFPLAAVGNAVSDIAFKGETLFTSLLGKNDGVLDPSPRGAIIIIK
ncbi:MAG: hypothetical protein IJG18_01305 [Kiritimatiellae bacterium]|nr:hypothetical protein [Kiritimatiellia bacterium]